MNATTEHNMNAANEIAKTLIAYIQDDLRDFGIARRALATYGNNPEALFGIDYSDYWRIHNDSCDFYAGILGSLRAALQEFGPKLVNAPEAYRVALCAICRQAYRVLDAEDKAALRDC